MEDFASESDSDYTSYWRDWVSATALLGLRQGEAMPFFSVSRGRLLWGVTHH